MENKEIVRFVPYTTFESTFARVEAAHKREIEQKERTEKRLVAIIILLIAVIVGMVCYYVWHEAQYEDIVTTITQEVTQEAESGTNRFVGGDYYGSADGKDH